MHIRQRYILPWLPGHGYKYFLKCYSDCDYTGTAGHLLMRMLMVQPWLMQSVCQISSGKTFTPGCIKVCKCWKKMLVWNSEWGMLYNHFECSEQKKNPSIYHFHHSDWRFWVAETECWYGANSLNRVYLHILLRHSNAFLSCVGDLNVRRLHQTPPMQSMSPTAQ